MYAFSDVPLSRCHAEIFLWGIFHEVVALHPEFAAEFDDVVAFFGMLPGLLTASIFPLVPSG